jgi:hypothetical protein
VSGSSHASGFSSSNSVAPALIARAAARLLARPKPSFPDGAISSQPWRAQTSAIAVRSAEVLKLSTTITWPGKDGPTDLVRLASTTWCEP